MSSTNGQTDYRGRITLRGGRVVYFRIHHQHRRHARRDWIAYAQRTYGPDNGERPVGGDYFATPQDAFAVILATFKPKNRAAVEWRTEAVPA